VRALVRSVAVLACAAGLAGCLRDVDPYLEERHTVAGGKPKEAPEAIRAYGCGSCHAIPGIRGADALVGPPLTSWSRRHYIAGRVPNEPDELVRWILDPQSIKPGTAMPNLNVAPADAQNIAAYLFTLK
jgi:cytochrome c